jgi:hypothetical protein
MLDDFEKAQELLTAMRECLPFEVRLTPALAAHLRSRGERRGRRASAGL